MRDDAVSFRAACVQMRSGLNRTKNVSECVDFIAQAADEGAQFIVTPEMTNVVDAKPKRLLATLPGEDALDEINTFAEAAARHSVWLLIGSMAVKVDNRRAANRSYLFADDGRLVASYDKLHMFDVDLPNGESWRESNVYQAGENAVLVKSPFAQIGCTICYDVRFPSLYRSLAQAGADVICVPAAFTRQTGAAHWKTLLRARAIETGSFIIAPGQGGEHEDGRETWGHSMIIDPWGEILAERDNDTPGIIWADIEPSRTVQARARIPNLTLERRYKIAILPE